LLTDLREAGDGKEEEVGIRTGAKALQGRRLTKNGKRTMWGD